MVRVLVGVSTCVSSRPLLCRNYLKPPSAHMWGWPISLSDWVNREKRNVAQHQSPGGQNRSQLVLLTEAFMLQLNKSWGQTSSSSLVPRSGTEAIRKPPAINEEEIFQKA